MSASPLVSVVIPTYNHADFLRDALQSVCNQTFTNWEAIVVNNYSEDDTVAVVEAFGDFRIRLENFRNKGIIAASRNRGITLARGSLVAFLDSDDTWYPDKLLRCIPYLDKGADLVCHELRRIGSSEGDLYCGPLKGSILDALLDEGCCLTTSATLVRKSTLESVGGFSEYPAIVTAEDYHLWIKLAKAGTNMHFIHELLGEYRTHDSNQSSSVLRHLNAILHVVEEFLPIADSSAGLKMKMRLRRRKGLAYYGAGRGTQNNKQFTKAWPFFFRALAYRPFYGKTYAAMVLNIIATLRPRSLHSGKHYVA